MISLPAFLISLAIGLFFVYVMGADRKEVVVYPGPETVNNVLFKDNANQCFQMEAKEVGCPIDAFEVPVQAS